MKKLLVVSLALAALLSAAPAYAQHSATLSWNAVTVPAPQNLTYKLQRATAAAGPFTQLGTPTAGLTLTDTTVNAGTTYFYRLISSCPTTGAGCGTAANPITGDSAPSTSVSATIPNDSVSPPIPVNLTITVQ